MPGRLNIFQRTMLLWNELHPYHAVHVVRVSAPLELARLTDVVNRTLAALGLATVTLDSERGRYRFEGVAARYEVKPVQAGPEPHGALAIEAACQLNTRFAPDRNFKPFRFFAARDRDSFFLGLVYFHALADGESVIHFLKCVVEAYLGRADPAGFELCPGSHDAILFRDPGLFVRKVTAMVSQLRTLRRARRVPCRNPEDTANAVVFFSLSPEELHSLIQAGKTWEVTLNDLFLALLLQALAQQWPQTSPASRRSKLAVGCIVNLRRELGLAGRRLFGLFLGSFVVTCQPRPEIPLAELAREVRRQTVRIKANRLPVGTPLELRFARMLLRLFSLERRRKFYQKNYPLWGGLTNMNLDSIWPANTGEPPVEYLRAVSTGPATPLVLSITTAGGGVTVGLSYRTACFSAAAVEQVKGCFLESVRGLPYPA